MPDRRIPPKPMKLIDVSYYSVNYIRFNNDIASPNGLSKSIPHADFDQPNRWDSNPTDIMAFYTTDPKRKKNIVQVKMERM